MWNCPISKSIALLIILLSCSAAASGGVYTLTVNGERLEFVAEPQRGYVVKLPDKAGGISAFDAEDATPVGGLDRRGVWVVEEEGLVGQNEETIRSLRAGGRVAYAAPLFSSSGETIAVLPEIVVRVNPGVQMEEVQRLCEAADCTIRKRMEFTMQEYLLEVLGPDADAVFAAVEQLHQAPEVEWACPNTAFRGEPAGETAAGHGTASAIQMASSGGDPNTLGVFPDDEYFPMQWHLHNTGQSGGTPGADIRAPEAWEITTGDPNIVIAIVDNGVESTHPDLCDNVVSGYDFYEDDDSPEPELDDRANGHGTWCAGLVAARGDNSMGVVGVTWNCKIMPIRRHRRSAQQAGDSITIAEHATAFRWAAENGADILSNSWGRTSALPILHSAIVDITKPRGLGRNGNGCVVLACSANDSGPIRYPAAYPEVIAVGATDHNDLWSYYSNFGPELSIVTPSAPGNTLDDLAATEGKGWLWTTDLTGTPGLDIFNQDPSILDYTDCMNGTSGACPIAAGVAALILSVEPDLTSAEVQHFLERSAKDLGDPGRDDYYGWGRVDARAALDMVLAKRADLNGDWKVDEQDLAILTAAIDANDLSADIAPAGKRDGVVDANDLALLTQYLGTEIPELGLIAHWKLDETEGMVAHDSAGKHHDATVMGVPLWQPEGGMIGGALQFSGVPNFAAAGAVRDPSEGPLSVFAWIKGGGPGQVIVSQQAGANWLMANAGDGALRTELESATRQARTLTSETAITDGDWHRVGLTWDGETRILYVDDVEVVRDAQDNLAGSMAGLLLGAGANMAPATFFSGLIDDARIYDRAVTP